MVVIGKRMLLSLEGILKSTGTAMLDTASLLDSINRQMPELGIQWPLHDEVLTKK